MNLFIYSSFHFVTELFYWMFDDFLTSDKLTD
jgi:hypothetical protein